MYCTEVRPIPRQLAPQLGTRHASGENLEGAEGRYTFSGGLLLIGVSLAEDGSTVTVTVYTFRVFFTVTLLAASRNQTPKEREARSPNFSHRGGARQ